MTSVEIRIDEILKTYTKSQVATDATGQRLTPMEISFQYQPNAIGVKEAKQKLLALLHDTEREARIDELETIQNETWSTDRTWKYLGYRIAELQAQAQEKE